MTIREYYNIILDRLEKGNYQIGTHKKSPQTKEEIKNSIKTNELPLHALNYLIFEYLKDNDDNRWSLIFPYVIRPRGVNKKGCDIDFTKISVDELVEFMITIKTI